MLSAKSMSSSNSQTISLTLSSTVVFITQSITPRNSNGDIIHPFQAPELILNHLLCDP
uniref:Uncharacterized protein n=1 Tax=Arion vulgaris TaxID=1028688 RepID=A0A0B7AMC9_9EUPU